MKGYIRRMRSERCPPARSRVSYSYLFSMYDGIIVDDNYRCAQRAYTIGRLRIQKLSDKKLGPIIRWENSRYFKPLPFYILANANSDVSQNYLFRRRDFSTLNSD